MLTLDLVTAGYGETRVLHGVSLSVYEQEVVALMGRNGTGKTTTLRTIIGLTARRGGRIEFNGADIAGRSPHALAAAGISYLPEHRGIFPSLTVHEHLTLVEGRRRGPWTVEQAYDLFPRLRERRKNKGLHLSGGEQQMLAIARALILNPLLLLLDEPTQGLAPLIIREIGARLSEIKRDGATILLVEQNLDFVLTLADRIYILGRGQVQWEGTPGKLRLDREAQSAWLGV